jgi:hypothetical protein
VETVKFVGISLNCRQYWPHIVLAQSDRDGDGIILILGTMVDVYLSALAYSIDVLVSEPERMVKMHNQKFNEATKRVANHNVIFKLSIEPGNYGEGIAFCRRLIDLDNKAWRPKDAAKTPSC